MKPIQFLKTLYYGDSACKGIVIDSWNNRIALQVNTISRIRSLSGNWDFYSDEDIIDGFIVFTGVTNFAINPAGYLPNDQIVSIVVNEIELLKETKYQFVLSIKSDNTNVEVIIVANEIFLEDPQRPGIKIE